VPGTLFPSDRKNRFLLQFFRISYKIEFLRYLENAADENQVRANAS
jgi:hypothetical protein